MSVIIPDRLETFEAETGQKPTFGNFVTYYDIDPDILLASESWSGWKARARLAPTPKDPDLSLLQESLVYASYMNAPEEIRVLKKTVGHLQSN
ncbi:type III restriction protein res subunit, partial [mine drainage metagenome]